MYVDRCNSIRCAEWFKHIQKNKQTCLHFYTHTTPSISWVCLRMSGYFVVCPIPRPPSLPAVKDSTMEHRHPAFLSQDRYPLSDEHWMPSDWWVTSHHSAFQPSTSHCQSRGSVAASSHDSLQSPQPQLPHFCTGTVEVHCRWLLVTFYTGTLHPHNQSTWPCGPLEQLSFKMQVLVQYQSKVWTHL